MVEYRRLDSLAVLIDADNTSARYAQAIFAEITRLGQANVRRIYGDFSTGRLAAWDPEIKSLAMLQQQQRSNTTGKNSADIALVIDAMDLMHKDKLDGFCLVSSDSDFTRLAQRLREEGLEVYGFGERKTPDAFRNACHRFIYVENLVDAKPEQQSPSTGPGTQTKEPPASAVSLIANVIEDTDDNGWINLSEVGNRILATAPDFDPRTYGCPNLSTLVTMSGGFDVRKQSGTAVHIRRKSAETESSGNDGNKDVPGPDTKAYSD